MKFHILYREKGEHHTSVGITVEADDPITAYGLYLQKTPPTSEFIALYCIDIISALLHHQIEQADKFPTPELFINSSSQAVEQEGTKENE